MMELAATADLCRLLGDPTRLRLLSLLGEEELSVVELMAATGLGQSRVSTHLGKLREAGLVRQRRSGTSTFHSLDESRMDDGAARLLTTLEATVGDALLEEDKARLGGVLARRGGSWADSVAGRMERHYSPGRTWQSAARALVGLGRFGDVLDVASGDGALAELVAPRARSVTCVDLSPRVVEAGRRRLTVAGLRFLVGDMHDLPVPGAGFDQVMLLNTLSFAEDPARVVQEVARVLRPGGDLVATTLAAHGHETVARGYDHRQMGFAPEALTDLFAHAGLEVESCAVTSRERRAPHFAVITLTARRPDGAGPASTKRTARRGANKGRGRTASRTRKPGTPGTRRPRGGTP